METLGGENAGKQTVDMGGRHEDSEGTRETIRALVLGTDRTIYI